MGSGNTIAEWSQVQAKKQWILAQNKPTTITMRLSQLTPVVGPELTAGSEEYAVVKPRYISTNHTGIGHFGLNIRFDSLDGTALNQTDRVWPEFRIVAKIYMTCKGVA